jgi:hypothetical protein
LPDEASGPVDGVPVVLAPGPVVDATSPPLDADVGAEATILVMNVLKAKSGHDNPASSVVSQEENCINAWPPE